MSVSDLILQLSPENFNLLRKDRFQLIQV